MTDWKKITKTLLTVLLLVLLGVEVCMELRYPCDELSITSTDTEAILRRVPEAVIAEEDKALLTELLGVPSVQNLLEGGENGDIYASEDREVAAVAEKHLSEEEAGSLNVSVLFSEDKFAVFTGWRGGKHICYLQLTPEERGAAYYKLCSPRRGVSYENWNNERAQKSEVHRRWLAWLRDGMWKDEE